MQRSAVRCSAARQGALQCDAARCGAARWPCRRVPKDERQQVVANVPCTARRCTAQSATATHIPGKTRPAPWSHSGVSCTPLQSHAPPSSSPCLTRVPVRPRWDVEQVGLPRVLSVHLRGGCSAAARPSMDHAWHMAWHGMGSGRARWMNERRMPTSKQRRARPLQGASMPAWHRYVWVCVLDVPWV